MNNDIRNELRFYAHKLHEFYSSIEETQVVFEKYADTFARSSSNEEIKLVNMGESLATTQKGQGMDYAAIKLLEASEKLNGVINLDELSEIIEILDNVRSL